MTKNTVTNISDSSMEIKRQMTNDVINKQILYRTRIHRLWGSAGLKYLFVLVSAGDFDSWSRSDWPSFWCVIRVH